MSSVCESVCSGRKIPVVPLGSEAVGIFASGSVQALPAPARYRNSFAADADRFDVPAVQDDEPWTELEPEATARRKRLRVMLVDDHKMVREGLAGLLRIEDDIEVVAEAADGQMAIDLARQVRPDVIVMDVSMPRVNGIEATRRISAEIPEVRIVGLSMHEHNDMARAMRQAGAAAYVSKDGPTDALLAAIRDTNGD